MDNQTTDNQMHQISHSIRPCPIPVDSKLIQTLMSIPTQCNNLSRCSNLRLQLYGIRLINLRKFHRILSIQDRMEVYG